ncbi:unnamed protein product [Cuscuta epithymum]|uniref:Uncharacterized protein n=1 Tax=Cuscuta epithymum TaxID=186058 RepID=A0AAV0C1E1_9ASTE|nr:unnamed protein product [Cuscuta epithymum]
MNDAPAARSDAGGRDKDGQSTLNISMTIHFFNLDGKMVTHEGLQDEQPG